MKTRSTKAPSNFLPSQIDQLFEEKILAQTKKLANGKEIKIFSRRTRGSSGNYMYSCHLCGFIDLGDEKALHLHVIDKMHRDLLKLELLPMRSWMKESIVEDQQQHEVKQPCALGCGDCSDLKAMLESMCGIKSTKAKPGSLVNAATQSFANIRKDDGTPRTSANLKRSSTSKETGFSKEKKRRHRSPKARRSRSKSRKSTK